MSGETRWPLLTEDRAAAMLEQLPEPFALEAAADSVTLYAGGGASAHKLREAARLVREARGWIIGEVAGDA